MEVILFDKKIPIKSHYCSLNGSEMFPIKEPYVNLYIQLKGCNAKCSFCSFQNVAKPFDFNKFEEVLQSLQGEIRVNKISITGGEPTLNLPKLYKIINLVRLYFPDSFFVMNTNGSSGKPPRYNVPLVEMFYDGMLEKFDSISISRHHYTDYHNDEIFGEKNIFKQENKGDFVIDVTSNGIHMLSKQQLQGLQSMVNNKNLFHLSCNLIKGQIDSTQKIYNYLEFANYVKIYDVGFVSLMKINDFCKFKVIIYFLSRIYLTFNKITT
jgi:organic radical activating enzyme